MEYVVEHFFDINHFDFWGRAGYVVLDFKERGKLKDLENMIEDAFESEQYVTDEMINSYVSSIDNAAADAAYEDLYA